jgi:uncharacterized protein (DUF3084 family)
MDSELKTYLDAMERRIVDRMRQIETGLKDGMIVTNGMVDRHSYGLQEHEQWLRDHTRAIAQHREWLQEHDAFIQEHDAFIQQHEAFVQEHEAFVREHEAAMHELDRKLDRIADLILRGRGSNGGNPEPEER